MDSIDKTYRIHYGPYFLGKLFLYKIIIQGDLFMKLITGISIAGMIINIVFTLIQWQELKRMKFRLKQLNSYFRGIYR